MWNIIKQAQEVAATAASRLQEGGSALLERLDGAEDVDEEYDEEEDGEDGEEKEKGVARSSDVSSPKHAISDTDSLSGDAREDEIAALKELVKVSAIRESELSSVLAEITHQYSSLKDQLKEEHAKTEKMKRAIDRQLGAKAEVASLREKLNEVKQMRDGIKGEVSATLQTLSTSMASEMSNVLQAIQRAGPVSTSPAPSVSVPVPVPVPVPAAALPAVSSPQPQPGGALLARAERADAAAQALREELEATKERLSKAETKVCEAETLMSSLSKAKDAAGKQQADDLRREIETLTKAEAETKAHFVGKMDKLQAELSASKALNSKQCLEAAAVASAEKASAELQKQLADAHTAAAVEKEALQKQLADAQKQMASLQASGSGKHKELAAEKEALQQQLADRDKALAAEIKAMKKQLTDAQKTAASEKEALQKQISDAQKQLASMQAASSDAAAQLADKDKALSAEKDATKKQLTDVHTAAAAEKEVLQKQISEAQKQVASLQSSGSEAAALLSVQLAETQQSSAAEKKALQKQLADKDQALAAEKEAMQKQLADVQKQLAAKGKMESGETEELKKQLAGAQKQLADKDKASAAESEELKKQLSAGKETTKKQLADSRKAAAAEKEGLQKQLVDSQRQVADKDKALAAEKEAMQKQLADVQKQLASLQASGSEAASLLSDAQKAASAEIEGLQKQLTEAQGQVADKNRALAAEIEGLQKQLASLQAASSDAAAQLADKDKALSAEKDAMKKQLAEVHTSAAAEKEVLQKKISEAQKQVADNDKALAAEKEALHKQLADKNKAVSAEAEELKKQLAGAQKQLADAQKTAASEKEALQKQLADKDKAVSAERETFEKLVADAQKATSTEKEVLRKQLADKDKLWAAERVEREAQQVKLSGLETDLEKRVLENAKLHNQVSEAAARVAGATKAETEAQRRIEELVGALKLAKEEALAATSTCDSARREARELCEKVAKLETVQRASDEAGRGLKQRVDGMVKSEAHLQAQLDEARAAAQLASKAQDELSKMEEKKRRDLDFLKKQNERIAQMQREHAEVQQAQSESLMDLSAQLDDSRTRETASALLASERGAELSSLQKHLATLQEATKHTRSQQESELGAAVATARAAEQELLVLVRRLTEELSAAEQRAADATALADNASSSSAATLAKIETAALERETALRAEYEGRFKEGQQRLALIEAERTRLENELSEAFSQPSSGSIGSRQRPDRVALGVLDIEGGQAPALNSASSSIASDAGATHDQDQDLHLRDDQKKKDAYSHPRLLQVWALVRTYAPSLLPMLGDNPPQLSRESVANAAFVYTVLIHVFLVYTLLF